MSLILMLLSIIGGAAVLSFILFVILGMARGWKADATRVALRTAFALGIICGIVGAVSAFV